MNVKQLIEVLKKYDPKSEVVIEWETFMSDDWSHSAIASVKADTIYDCDGDGSIKTYADGREKEKAVVSLAGN